MPCVYCGGGVVWVLIRRELFPSAKAPWPQGWGAVFLLGIKIRVFEVQKQGFPD